jgi:hypothetical protein
MAPPLLPATELNSGQHVVKILEIMNLTSHLSLESATNLNDFRDQELLPDVWFWHNSCRGGGLKLVHHQGKQ